MTTNLERQVKVSKMLSLGFVLSMVGVGGLGSLAALIIGLKAQRLIKQSNGEVAGMRMAWWCIIVGGLGTLTLPPLLILLITSQQK
jgi:uncharacterized BrkB/YihY/UPF0761 family membrane protein